MVMLRVVVNSFLLAVISSAAFAQHLDTAWIHRFNGPANGDDRVSALCVDGVGRSVILGSTPNGTTADFVTIFHQYYNDVVWTRQFHKGADAPLAVDVQRGYGLYNPYSYVAGCSDDDFLVVKYNYNTGDTIWVRTYSGPGNGPDSAVAIAVDEYGNAYVTGPSLGAGNDGFDIATIKYSANGDIAWVRRYNHSCSTTPCSDDISRAIGFDRSGNVLVTGSAGRPGAFDFVTLKYLPNGDLSWTSVYRGSVTLGDDRANALAVDTAGNVYVTGYTGSSGLMRTHYVTIKYLPNGDTAWTRTYLGADYAGVAKSIAVDRFGNVCVAGQVSPIDPGWTEYTTLRYSSNGDLLWSRRFRGLVTISDAQARICVDTAGSVYVGGTSYEAATGKDFVVVKYFPNGTTAWSSRYNGPAGGDDELVSLAIGPGGLFASGTSLGIGSGLDFATIKYQQHCCLGSLGNVDGSVDHIIDITDLFLLIDWLVAPIELGPEICPEAANVDAVGGIDISDLMTLVDFLATGVQLIPCP